VNTSLRRRALNRRSLFGLTSASMLLAACGGGGSQSTTSSSGAPAASQTAQPTPTGTITFYTASPEDLANALGMAFTSQTGVKVSVLQSDTGSILAKLDGEKANPHADVVILADWSAALGLAGQGQLLTYQAKNSEKVPAVYRDPKNQFISQGLTGLAIAYNTKVVKNPPTSIDQLTGPDWKDQITMPDPSQSGSVYSFVAAQLQRLGDSKGWALFDALKKNGMQVLGTNAKALAPVLTGSKAAIIGAADHTSLASVATGESIAVGYLTDATVVAPRPMMIMKSAPNPVAARAFMDFVLSDDGQKLVAKSFLIPARQDIPTDPARKPLNQLNALPVDWDKAIASQQDTLTRFANEITR
jgi:iron(III) transport system substrate-binding protein